MLACFDCGVAFDPPERCHTCREHAAPCRACKSRATRCEDCRESGASRLRARFVGRARGLRKHRPFLEALAAARGAWDAAYPEFAIGVPPERPSHSWDPCL